MRITKKQIAEKVKTTQMDTNIFLHQYETGEDTLSVRTYRYGRRPADQAETRAGFGIGEAANKKEFIDRVHNHINK